MMLIAPWALWFALIGPAVIALYLLKIKHKSQSVPSLEFWRRLAPAVRVRSLFRHLKRWLSLLVWLLIAACLILALGNPVFSWGRIKPRSIAIILDNSASMQTIEDSKAGTTRLAQSFEAVHDLLDRRPVSDEWLLIEAGTEPRVLQNWTRNPRAIEDSLKSITPNGGTADVAAATALVSQLAAGKSAPAIVLISDGAGVQNTLPDKEKSVMQWPIGKAIDNVGITKLAARPHRQQLTHSVFVSLVNSLDTPVDSRIIFDLNDLTIAVEAFTIAPAGTWEKTITVSAPEGGVLRARIDRPDALAIDNTAYTVLDPIKSARVLLVSPAKESFFFEQALAAMELLVDAEASRVVAPEEYDQLDLSKDPPDLIVFNHFVPARLPPTGAFVCVNDWPKELPFATIGSLDQPSIAAMQSDHPLMRYVNIAGCKLARAKDVTINANATVLAKSRNDAPLIVLYRDPSREFLCLTFDLLDSDLPVRNAFPILLHNAVVHLISEKGQWIKDRYSIGEVIHSVRALPPEITTITVSHPRDEKITSVQIAARDGTFFYQDTAQSGVLRFDVGREHADTVVDLSDQSESRITPVKFADSVHDRLELTGRVFGIVPWLAFAIAALGLISFEWFTYHQRWTE